MDIFNWSFSIEFFVDVLLFFFFFCKFVCVDIGWSFLMNFMNYFKLVYFKSTFDLSFSLSLWMEAIQIPLEPTYVFNRTCSVRVFCTRVIWLQFPCVSISRICPFLFFERSFLQACFCRDYRLHARFGSAFTYTRPSFEQRNFRFARINSMSYVTSQRTLDQFIFAISSYAVWNIIRCCKSNLQPARSIRREQSRTIRRGKQKRETRRVSFVQFAR